MKILLRDGRRAIIRLARLADATDLLEVEQTIVAAGVGVVQGLEDLPTTEEEYGMRMAEQLENSEKRLCYGVAEVEGHVVAYGRLERLGPVHIRHVAAVALGVVPALQGRGIGRALMNYLLDWARGAPGSRITRIELSVGADNLWARNLYASLGFELEGRRRRFLRDADGHERDDCFMALFLDHHER